MGAVLLMAFALSLDGFGVGLTYGLRRIRVPFSSMLVIAFWTVFAMGISMLFGHWIKLWLKIFPAGMLGAVILLGLGSFQLLQAIRRNKQGSTEANSVPEAAYEEEKLMPVMAANREVTALEPVLKINLRFLGLVIQVLRAPAIADLDCSGTISIKESVLLGIALAMDAFATGIGAALAGMSLSVVGVVAFTQLAMIQTGQELAGKVPDYLLEKVDFLPGVVLILIGLGKLF